MMSGLWSWVTWMRERRLRSGVDERDSGGRERVIGLLLLLYLFDFFVCVQGYRCYFRTCWRNSFIHARVGGSVCVLLSGRESCWDRLPLQLATACQAGAPNIATARHLIPATHRNAPTVGVGHLGGGRVCLGGFAGGCAWAVGYVGGRAGARI